MALPLFTLIKYKLTIIQTYYVALLYTNQIKISLFMQLYMVVIYLNDDWSKEQFGYNTIWLDVPFLKNSFVKSLYCMIGKM